MRLFFLSKLGRWIDVVQGCNVFWFFVVVIPCFTASMLWSLVLSPRSVRTVGTRFQLLHNADILSPIDGLPVKAPPGLDTARQIFLRSSGSFATKRLWTSHALHQSQGQDRNRLSEYRFPCSWVVWTALSAVPLFTWLSPNTHAIRYCYCLLFILLLSHFIPDCMYITTSSITDIVLEHNVYVIYIDTIYFWYYYYASNQLAVPFTPSVETILLARRSKILIYKINIDVWSLRDFVTYPNNIMWLYHMSTT